MPTTHTLMSQESFEKYGGLCCPVCHSSHVEAEPGTLTADGDVAWDEVTCNDCASTWRELFRCSEYTQLVVSDKLKDEPCKHCGQALSEHDGEGQCPVPDDDDDGNDKEEQALALAALPDMVEALKRTVASCHNWSDCSDWQEAATVWREAAAECEAALDKAVPGLGATTRLEQQRLQNERERVVYQPEYHEQAWASAGFCSFMAFRTEDECRRVFPALEAIRYSEDEIEDLRIVLPTDLPRDE